MKILNVKNQQNHSILVVCLARKDCLIVLVMKVLAYHTLAAQKHVILMQNSHVFQLDTVDALSHSVLCHRAMKMVYQVRSVFNRKKILARPKSFSCPEF